MRRKKELQTCRRGISDVIFTISTAALRRSYPFKDEPILKEFCEVNKTIINSIRIYITDALGKIINLNKVDTSFTFILKDNKNTYYNDENEV